LRPITLSKNVLLSLKASSKLFAAVRLERNRRLIPDRGRKFLITAWRLKRAPFSFLFIVYRKLFSMEERGRCSAGANLRMHEA
jgi:hypothetical protein